MAYLTNLHRSIFSYKCCWYFLTYKFTNILIFLSSTPLCNLQKCFWSNYVLIQLADIASIIDFICELTSTIFYFLLSFLSFRLFHPVIFSFKFYYFSFHFLLDNLNSFIQNNLFLLLKRELSQMWILQNFCIYYLLFYI
jgi:hypothetical protein